MNKPIVNVEAKIFLYAFAILGLAGGIYSFIGLGILESDGFDLNTFSGWVLHGLSFAAMIAAVGAICVISLGRVGGWWILGSWLSTLAFFGLGYVVV